MQSQTSVVSGTTTYSYDAAGNLVKSVDARQAAHPATDGTAGTYDAANRIVTSTSVLTGQPTETASWTYDLNVVGVYGLGRVTSMTDPTGKTQYSYDRRGLLETDRKAVWDNTFATLYTYDANGNRSTVKYPSGRTVSYSYDFADRPAFACSGGTGPTCTGGTTYVASTSYQPFGPASQLKFGNGTTRNMILNQRYQMTSNKLTKDSNGAVLADYHTYTYDGVGNVTAIPDATDSTYSRTVLGYDDLNRLTTATSGSSLWGSASYSYDAMGNVFPSLTVGTRSATFTYVSSGGHQTPKVATASDESPTTVSYDVSGNETVVGSGTYVYSSRTFLASGSGASEGEGFAYDYDGRGIRTAAREVKLAITGLSPVSRAAGLGGFTLTVNGTNFTGTSTVKWNGSARTTAFVSSTQLTATINASDVATAGTVTPVTVTDGASTSCSSSAPFACSNFVTDFSDVASGTTFYPFVTIIGERAITGGCGSGNYCPSTAVTRAQMAVFLLVSQEGAAYSPPACTTQVFNDVPCTSGFAPWINELARRGVTTGCGGGNYCPNDPVTRAQMSVFLLVTLEGSSYAPPACTGIFSDVACPSGFANWIEELARRGIAGGCGGGNYCPNDSVTRGQMAVFLVGTWGFTTAATPAGQKRLFFYTPEMNLMVETEYTASYHPQVFYEHFWLGGQPVAETDTGTSTVHWTMTDHLGTPVLWTDSTAAVTWRVEHEPYGKVFKLRSGSASHQPLRLPGQEAEQLGASSETALNGQTKRSYNIFRWYRPNWGRYTQGDPIFEISGHIKRADPDLFGYVSDNPIRWDDPFGLQSTAVPSIQCDGNNHYEVVNAGNACDSECTILHEETHIRNWEARYGKNSCRNKKKGYLQVGGTGYAEFLKRSECSAYATGLNCRLTMVNSGCCPSAKLGITRDLEQLEKLGCR